mgnify:CR=1 FL=1
MTIVDSAPGKAPGRVAFFVFRGGRHLRFRDGLARGGVFGGDGLDEFEEVFGLEGL